MTVLFDFSDTRRVFDWMHDIYDVTSSSTIWNVKNSIGIITDGRA